MASTNNQIAKKIADALNDSRGHTQGRNPILYATYTSGATVTVVLRERNPADTGDRITKTITVS